MVYKRDAASPKVADDVRHGQGMQSAVSHPPGHAYPHPHRPAHSMRPSSSGLKSLFGSDGDRVTAEQKTTESVPHSKQGNLHPQLQEAERACDSPRSRKSNTPRPYLRGSPTAAAENPRPLSRGSIGGSPRSNSSSPSLFLPLPQQESKMVVTSTPAQTEAVGKMARYSVESYSPSPDANDSLDKSAMEDDDDEDDDEFSDGGHYRGPPPDYRPPGDDRFRYTASAGRYVTSGASPHHGGESESEEEEEDGGEKQAGKDGTEELELKKRMFFQGYLNGSRQMGYPLRGYPPPSLTGSDEFPPGPPRPSQADSLAGMRRSDAFDPYAMMRHHHHHHHLHQHQQQHHFRTGHIQDDHDPSRSYAGGPEGQGRREEGAGRPEPHPQSPRKETGSYGLPPASSPRTTPAEYPARSGGSGDPCTPFAAAAAGNDGAAAIKKEHPPASSPDSQRPPHQGGMVGLPPASSPLTKIPIPHPAPISPQRLGGYREMAGMHEMMMAGSMGGHPPQHPGMMPRGVPRAEGQALGHLYFCHLCQYSGNSKDEFDLHMTIHFEHNCPHCDYTSRTEGRLKRHIKDFHSDPDSKTRTMPGRPKVFKCKQCEYSTTDKIAFWTHARVHIKEEKLLACPQCPFVTEYKHHLEYHLRNHFGSKPHKCGKCNYSCVNKSMLNSHMKSHTNVYQYRCADCTYATKYCHSLKLHLKKYNHKPATVLNSDGSLPQGIDAEISGLSLIAKRGPPRGPRGLRKDKDCGDDPGILPGGPGGFIPGFPGFPMSPCHLPRGPGLPHMMNGGLFPGMWPMMPKGIHPPPPLIPMSALGGPSPMDQAGREAGPREHSQRWGNEGKEEGRCSESRGVLQCRMCCFAAETPESMQGHVFKVHASENRDLLSMLPFSLNPESLMDADPSGGPSAASRHARRMSAPPPSNRTSGPDDSDSDEGEEAGSLPRRNTLPTTSPYRNRDSLPTPSPYRNSDSLPTASPYRNSDSLPTPSPYRNSDGAEAPWLHRRTELPEPMRWLHESAFLGRNCSRDREAGQAEGVGGTDILRQMTRRFGDSVTSSPSGVGHPSTITSESLMSPLATSYTSVTAAAMSIAASIAAQATREAVSGPGNEQGAALDLTRKPSPPVAGPSSHPPAPPPAAESAATPSPSPPPPPPAHEPDVLQVPQAEKRPYAAMEGGAHSSEENVVGEDGTSQPRKRSRKGKAIKRVRPEHVPLSPELGTGDNHPAEEEEEGGSRGLAELFAPAAGGEGVWSVRGQVTSGPAASRADASTGPDDDEEERFRKLQKELQLLNSQSQDDGPRDSEIQTSPIPAADVPLNEAASTFRVADGVDHRPDRAGRDEESQAESGEVGLVSQFSPRTSALEARCPGSSSLRPDTPPANPAGQQEWQEDQEDSKKEREALIKAIYQNRRQAPNPAVRRGADLAYKLLLDTVKDPNDPALKALRDEEETACGPPPSLSLASTVPNSPSSNGMTSYRFPADDVRTRQHTQGYRAALPRFSPPMTSHPATASSLTSPRNGTRELLRGGLHHPHHHLPHGAPPQHPASMAVRLPGGEPFFGLGLAGRMALKPPGLPERMSAFAQTYPVLQYAEMLAETVAPSMPFPPPPGRAPHSQAPPPPQPSAPQGSSALPPPPPPLPQHLPTAPPLSAAASSSAVPAPAAPAHMYECHYCDLLFKDHLMHTLHMAQHRPGNPFACSCGHVSSDKVEFYLHQMRHPHS